VLTLVSSSDTSVRLLYLRTPPRNDMRRRVRLRVRMLACTAVLALTRALTPHYTRVFAGLDTRMLFVRVLASSLLSSADSGERRMPLCNQPSLGSFLFVFALAHTHVMINAVIVRAACHSCTYVLFLRTHASLSEPHVHVSPVFRSYSI
jgi:hypothetical protein